jgi:hypothetical protein
MPDTETYFVVLTNCLNELSNKYEHEFTEGQLLSQLINKCILYGDNEDQNNTNEIRISAVTLLAELWLHYPFILHTN